MRVVGFLTDHVHTAVCGYDEGGPCGAAVYHYFVLEDEDGERFLTPICARSGNFSSVYALEQDRVWREICHTWDILEHLGLKEEAKKVLHDQTMELAFSGLHGEKKGEVGLFSLKEVLDPRIYGSHKKGAS